MTEKSLRRMYPHKADEIDAIHAELTDVFIKELGESLGSTIDFLSHYFDPESANKLENI